MSNYVIIPDDLLRKAQDESSKAFDLHGQEDEADREMVAQGARWILDKCIKTICGGCAKEKELFQGVMHRANTGEYWKCPASELHSVGYAK